MNDLYSPPQTSPPPSSNDAELRRKKKIWLRAIKISISGVILPPLVGMAVTAFSTIRTFGELSQGEEANSDTMSRDIGIALTLTAWGLVISAIAFVILIGALIRFFTLPKVSKVQG